MSFAVGIGVLLSQFRFDYYEFMLYDTVMSLRPPHPVSGKIDLIAIDAATITSMGRAPTALDHAELLRQLATAGAKVVVYLINPNEFVGAYDDLTEFAEASRHLRRLVVGLESTPLPGSHEAARLLPPFENIEAVSSPVAADNASFARDQVTRRMLLSYQGMPLLSMQLARELNPEMDSEKKVRGQFDYLESKEVLIDFRPSHSYTTTSFQDAMFGRFRNAEKNLVAAGASHPLDGHIVFVGRDLDTTTADYVKTPYSNSVLAMTLLEAQANMLDTIVQNSAPIKAPEWLGILLVCLISVLTVDRTMRERPARALMQLAATLLLFSSFCFLAFALFGWWVDMLRPLLAMFICYYFFIPYRLIMENRKSWEYFERNQLLTQVEELKSNFLSMMSHDLKTPLARIQGMAEIVAKDENPLSNRQKEALDRLARSAEELTQFISSVLNLGRIESKEIKLQLKSCDLNGLLEEVCSRAEDGARSKHMEIVREFEPIFSLKIDIDLMRQVFANLIENAIKYCPEKSRILVSTDEQDGKILVQVADQGPGIPASELPNLFMKFYRAGDAKSSGIKGSGLGLYLAKYFVELHRGRLMVDSSPGQGSTFTVELPLDGDSA